MPTSALLPSLAHAVSGSAGSAISTAATYPLDLVGTRLRAQRQLRAGAEGDAVPDSPSPSHSHYYDGVADALRGIPAREGGPAALFAGLPADAAKSAADSFLFFLFYTWARAARGLGGGGRGGAGAGAERQRRRRRRRYLPGAVEELVVGVVAGACARALTTPIANVVTRMQTESLVGGGGSGGPRSFGEMLADIRREKGVLGLWAGYSASLVLTLNPSITFFLQQMLTKSLVARQGWDDDDDAAPGVTFVLAAVSKVIATVVTYPFQIAKTRAQVSPAPVERDEGEDLTEGNAGKENKKAEAEAEPEKGLAKSVRSLADETIFATVARIGRDEGFRALYDGMSSELLKAFFSHGITMVAKDAVHKLLFRLYFAILAYLRRHPRTRARLTQAASNLSDGLRDGYLKVTAAKADRWRRSKEAITTNLLDGGQPRIIVR